MKEKMEENNIICVFYVITSQLPVLPASVHQNFSQISNGMMSLPQYLPTTTNTTQVGSLENVPD